MHSNPSIYIEHVPVPGPWLGSEDPAITELPVCGGWDTDPLTTQTWVYRATCGNQRGLQSHVGRWEVPGVGDGGFLEETAQAGWSGVTMGTDSWGCPHLTWRRMMRRK